jgi:uncharacterized protein involved in outer membrane biogenesis
MFAPRKLLNRRRKRMLIWAAALFVVFTVVGFFVIPPILRSVLTTQLSTALHREVTIREVRLNPFALSLTVRGLTVKEPKTADTFASFEELYVNLETSSLLRWGVVVREVRLTKPFVRLVRQPDETYNFSDLIPAPQPQPSAPSKPPRFSVNNIRIVDGGADIRDDVAQTKHTVREVNIGIPFLSNIPSYVQTFVQPAVSARINETRYSLEGKAKPFADSHETTLDLNIADLDLPYYLAYVPKELRTFAMPSGRLDAKLAIVFIQRGGEQTLAVRGDVGLRDVAIDDKQGAPVVRIPKLSLGLASIEPLTRKAHVSTLALEAPELTVRREKTGITNVETLLPKAAPAEKPSGKEATPPGAAVALDVDEISIAGAKVSWSDLLPRLPFKTTLVPVNLKIVQLSTRPETKGSYNLTVTTEAKEQIALEGSMSLTPVVVDGTLTVQAVPLKKYASYYGDMLLFDIEAGNLGLSTRYHYAQNEKEPDITAAEAAVSVSGLRLKRRNDSEDFVRVPSFAVKNTAIDVTRRQVTVGQVSTQKGFLAAKRLANGDVDLQKLFVSAPATPGPVVPAAGPPVRPWTIKATAVSVDQYRIQFTDEVPSEPVKVTVEDVNLKAERLSTAEKQPPGKISLALRLDKGTVSVSGAASITPVTADLQVAVKDIDIRPFQPYVTEKVKVTITDGRVSTSGRLQLSIKEPQGLQAQFTGDSNVAKFSALEKISADEILKWDSLAFQELSVGYNPLSIRAKKVALADFFAHVIIQPNGRLNLQEITSGGNGAQAADQPKTAPAPTAQTDVTPSPSASPAQDIQIQEITLQGGQVQFQDRTLKPNYSATWTELGGRVSGLSSLETSLADVELRGKMNNSAPLEIVGKVNPLKQDLFADVRVRFTGMDLSPTSPYAGKYVGYTIEKGKLSFDLTYLIDKRKLKSENKVFVDQFTFGEKVDSPTATNLPVRLAVALLKDRNGEIHLDIPVTGSIDDPQFSIWSVILQVLGNLIAKAATSPFALLGAAFGGGEEMQYVEFDPGRAVIPADGLKKIDTLATALSEKPSLKLEIAGYVSPEADREGLKQYFLQRKVKAQKLNDLVKKGSPAVPVDEVIVAPEEYEKYLTLAYRAEPFPKPRNFIGMVKGLPVPEMEKLMLTNIEAGDEELRQLASQRANAVKDALLQPGKVEAERVFIVEPKGLTPEKKDKVKDSRVEFKIA